MKELICSDTTTHRKLYQVESTNYQREFNVFILRNQALNMDGALAKRVKTTQFTSRFVSKPVGENEYTAKNISLNFDQWKVSFMNLLIQTYHSFHPQPQPQPQPQRC